MHGLKLLTLAIGAFAPLLACAEGEISEDGGSIHPGMVIVEPVEVMKIEKDGAVNLSDYRDRRGNWGSTISVGYSTYDPLNYTPQQTGDATTADGSFGFSTVYSRPDTPLLELQVAVKRNLEIGSLAGEIAAGYYKNNADTAAVASTLTLTPIRLGVTFAADVIWREPYVVPYLTAGGYVINYREEGTLDAVGGTTKVAPYANLGAQFQLDAIDRQASRNAYLDSGLQSTFVFLEARKFFASSAGSDPDLSNTVSYGAGLRVEF